MVRKTVDYQAAAARWLLDRRWQRDATWAPPWQPSPEYVYSLYPPCAPACRAQPVVDACTRFVHHAQNKQRCAINVCRWTPESRRLITGASTGEFTLWNGLTFNFETILLAHNVAVRCMQWSHDGKWMVTADQSGLVKYWLSNLNHLKVFRAHQECIRDLSFAPSDAKLVTCADDQTIRVWDFESPTTRANEVDGTPERILRGHGWDVRSVHWHPSKPLLASGSKDSLVKIWDPKTGKCLTTLHGHKSAVVKVRWNPLNGNYLLSGSRDQSIKLFDIRMMREVQAFRGHPREVTTLAWHPLQEDAFASGGYDGSMLFWVVGREEPVAQVLNAHHSQVWDLDWHPLGHMIVSASNDTYTRFWARPRPGDRMTDRYQRGSARWESLRVDIDEDDELISELQEWALLQASANAGDQQAHFEATVGRTGGGSGGGHMAPDAAIVNQHVNIIRRQRAPSRTPPGLNVSASS
ncbi:hypothetical protein CDCA_CDCA10G2950 [Cyanidium caldarium]|uniref:Polyadenylation factor subunit 2 n=1 Tax=Cyanidium caldarium TaxID=2771 RepID=A0AAV9IXW0_CYACA|nr:hypothetical protein CDCA_CDCA10G2950 [Cyanidium caldarium]